MEDGTAMTSHQVSDGVATAGGAVVTVAAVFGNMTFEVCERTIPFAGYIGAVYEWYNALQSNFQQNDIALGILSESVTKVKEVYEIITTFMREGRRIQATHPCLEKTVQTMTGIAQLLIEMHDKHQRELQKANETRWFCQRAYDYSKYTNRAQGFVAECNERMTELNAAVALWTAQTVGHMDHKCEDILRILEDGQRKLQAHIVKLQAQLAATSTALQVQQRAAERLNEQRVDLEAQNTELQAALEATNTAHQAQQLAAEHRLAAAATALQAQQAQADERIQQAQAEADERFQQAQAQTEVRVEEARAQARAQAEAEVREAEARVQAEFQAEHDERLQQAQAQADERLQQAQAQADERLQQAQAEADERIQQAQAQLEAQKAELKKPPAKIDIFGLQKQSECNGTYARTHQKVNGEVAYKQVACESGPLACNNMLYYNAKYNCWVVGLDPKGPELLDAGGELGRLYTKGKDSLPWESSTSWKLFSGFRGSLRDRVIDPDWEDASCIIIQSAYMNDTHNSYVLEKARFAADDDKESKKKWHTSDDAPWTWPEQDEECRKGASKGG